MERHVLNHDTPPSNVKNTLKAYQFSGLENVKTSLKILGTIPMTWCECERSFSGMRRLVNFCRTTIKWTYQVTAEPSDTLGGC